MSGSISRDFLTSIDSDVDGPKNPSLLGGGGGLTTFLKIYHDFVYFFCISPFRLVFTPAESAENKTQVRGEFQVKRWWPQKIFCVILTLLGFTWMVRDIRLSLPRAPSMKSGGASNNETLNAAVAMKNPTVYFVIMLQIAGTLLKLAVVRVFWRKQQQVCDILNFLCSRKPHNGSRNGHDHEINGTRGYRNWHVVSKRPLLVLLVCILYSVIALVNWVLGRGLSQTCYEGPLITRWNGVWWWTAMVEAGRYNFFLESRYWNGTEGNATFTKGDTFLGVIASLGFYYRRLLSSHCNCFLLMAIHTLLTCTKQFSQQLSSTSGTSPSLSTLTRFKTCQITNGTGSGSSYYCWTTVDRRYQSIKHLTKLLNSVYGWNVTLFLVESILYYAVSFDDIFVEHSHDNDITKVIRLLFYFGSSCAVLFSAADVSRQMINFKEWLSVEGNRRQIPIDQLHVTLNELDTNVVAIKGNNVFPVTYSLAAKLLGVTVTYFIICVQT